MDRAARDRRSLDILSVKKEAKLSVSEVNDVDVRVMRICDRVTYLLFAKDDVGGQKQKSDTFVTLCLLRFFSICCTPTFSYTSLAPPFSVPLDQSR